MAEERDEPELVAAAPDRVLVASGYPTADSYSVATWGRRRGGARAAVFKYSAAAHDVVEVTRSGYRSCSVESPEATFRTGNDAVQLNGVRVRYFIYGVPGHCAARMKLEVRVRPTGCDRPPVINNGTSVSNGNGTGGSVWTIYAGKDGVREWNGAVREWSGGADGLPGMKARMDVFTYRS